MINFLKHALKLISSLFFLCFLISTSILLGEEAKAQFLKYEKGGVDAKFVQNSFFNKVSVNDISTTSFDLNGDGQREIFAVINDPGWCGSAGCASKIYTRKGGQWEEILGLIGGEVQVAENSTVGWKDINITPRRKRFQVIRVFNGQIYESGHILDGRYRINPIPIYSYNATVNRSTPKFDHPEIGKVRKELLRANQSINIIGFIRGISDKDWYLCTLTRAADLPFYLPASLVNKQITKLQRQIPTSPSQNASLKTRRFAYDGERNPAKNFSISYPSNYYFRVDNLSGGYEIWNRQPSSELQTSISGDYDRPREVKLPTEFAFTYFNAESYHDIYGSLVASYIRDLQTHRTQFKRENVRVNGMEGNRFYFRDSRIPYYPSCCGVITVLRPNTSGRGYIRAISYTNDLKSDLQTILKIHNSIRRL